MNSTAASAAQITKAKASPVKRVSELASAPLYEVVKHNITQIFTY
jgi:hypothetical protein